MRLCSVAGFFEFNHTKNLRLPSCLPLLVVKIAELYNWR